ncbi:SHOCT domain-containing protein [Kineococcus sp. SYSU DK003]|uniref:SHOCT domain-containing protein n=1 Tax=Kineococcus sp. SYSU DK003 TaxID=3383124 RepID=UPI003D7C6DE7
MDAIVWLLVIGGTVWVGLDASRLGAARGRLGGGLLDMGTAAWVVCCLLFFLIAFPCYLATRGRLVAAQAAAARPAAGSGHRAAVSTWTAPVDTWAPSTPAVASASAPIAPTPRRGFVQELEEVTQMYKAGHLTEEEFRTAKARILRRSEG